jgi:H/ACA ribonucleoprotein complex subunit 4
MRRGNPKVTGVLPITLGEAAKTVQALLQSGKEYVCVMRLHALTELSRVRNVLKQFEGEVYQRPPLRAAVKRQLRTRRVYYIELLEMVDRNVLLRIGCEGGTYIRKLCHDIGEVLGTGAHMQELRRTRAGPFTEDDASFVTLHEVAYYYDEWKTRGDADALRRIVQPMETALVLLPKIVVRDSAVDALCHGANLTAPGVLSVTSGISPGTLTAVNTLKGEAVVLAEAQCSTEEILKLNHGIVAKTRRVLMPRGTYPKAWKTREG